MKRKHIKRYNPFLGKVTYTVSHTNYVGLGLLIAVTSLSAFLYSGRPITVKLVSPDPKPIYHVQNDKGTVLGASTVCDTEKCQIIDYITEKFGEHANEAFNVIWCENRAMNPRAVNHNRNGTVDRGIFQINSIHAGEEMFDYKKNIDMAYKIFHEQGDKWTAWTCSHRVNQKNYLGR